MADLCAAARTTAAFLNTDLIEVAGERDFSINMISGSGTTKEAAMRNILPRKGKTIEVLANHEPSLHYVSEWWKQLYGENKLPLKCREAAMRL